MKAERAVAWLFGLAAFFAFFPAAQALCSTAGGNNSFTAVAQDTLNRSDTNTVTVNLPSSISFSHDANGSLTNDGTRSFFYDDENQLTTVTVTGSWKSEFLYDGAGRRRITREYIWQNSTWVQSNEIRYVYSGLLPIQERDGNNLPAATYTRGIDLLRSFDAAGGIGGLLARSHSGSGQAAYYHNDGSGNITALVNDKQLIVARYLYDPYGNLLSHSGPLADANLYRFSSKQQHPSSGLYYYGYRFYEPNLQRWLNRDPLGELAGINLFRFNFNSPLNYVDNNGDHPLLLAVLVGAIVNALLTPYTANAPGPDEPSYPPVTGEEILANATIGAFAGVAGYGLTRFGPRPCPAAKGRIGPVLQGQAGVTRAIAEIEAQGGQVLSREVTLQVGAGRTRPDLFIRNAQGGLEFVEVKSGAGAALNPNQARLFPQIQQSGATPRGVNANIPGVMTPGVPIGPTPVRVITYP